MVDVPVDDCHPLCARGPEPLGGERHVVEEAVAVGASRPCVMSRRTDERVDSVRIACDRGIDRGEGGPGRRQERMPRARRENGRRSEPLPSGVARLLDARDVLACVDSLQLVRVGESPVPPRDPVGDGPEREQRPHVLDPLGVLWLQLLHGEKGRGRCFPESGAGVVLEGGRMPEHRELCPHGRHATPTQKRDGVRFVRGSPGCGT